MAGQPVTRTAIERIDKDYGEDGVFELVVELGGWNKTAKHIGVSRALLDKWVKKGGDERQRRKEQAIKASAETLVEQGQEILDELAESAGVLLTGPEVQLANSRANYRMKMAEVRDRDKFGDRSANVNVNLNVGDLHFEALLAHGRMPVHAAHEMQQLMPAEVIDATEDEDEDEFLASL